MFSQPSLMEESEIQHGNIILGNVSHDYICPTATNQIYSSSAYTKVSVSVSKFELVSVSNFEPEIPRSQSQNLRFQSKVSVSVSTFDTKRGKSKSQSQNLIPFSKVSVSTLSSLSIGLSKANHKKSNKTQNILTVIGCDLTRISLVIPSF